MREETRPIERMTVIGESLEHATGVPIGDLLEVMHWVRRYLDSCAAQGMQSDLRLALERAGLGELVAPRPGRHPHAPVR